MQPILIPRAQMPPLWEPPVWYLDGFEMPVTGACDFVEMTQLNTVYDSDPQIIRRFASCPVVTLCSCKIQLFLRGEYAPCHMFFLLP